MEIALDTLSPPHLEVMSPTVSWGAKGDWGTKQPPIEPALPRLARSPWSLRGKEGLGCDTGKQCSLNC